MPLYEHVFLARQDVSQAQVEAMMKEFQGVIQELGGKIAKTEYWGLKSLAYKIKKSRKAHFALMNLDAPPAAIAEMERRMSISSDVIRYLTIRVDEHEAEPSAQMRKSDRDDRRDRDGDRGGFRGGRGGGRFGDREGGGFRGGRGEGGGFRGGDRGTFRDRPPRSDGDRPPRSDGDRPPRSDGERPPRGDGDRPPRPPRDTTPSE